MTDERNAEKYREMQRNREISVTGVWVVVVAAFDEMD